jgi:hypothetical protein
MITPDCYTCTYRGLIPGDAHSKCFNPKASVTCDPHGVSSGWSYWPYNFDPIWLTSCSGWAESERAGKDREQIAAWKDENKSSAEGTDPQEK